MRQRSSRSALRWASRLALRGTALGPGQDRRRRPDHRRATPPSARSSRTASNRPSTTSTPPAASSARRSPPSFGDDVADPKEGVSVANKFVGDGVKFVIGHFNSGVTMPASEVYQENGILEITPAATNPTGHRAQHVEHLPHLRPRRPAGRGRRRLHPRGTSRARRSPSSTTRPPTARASPTKPRRRSTPAA